MYKEELKTVVRELLTCTKPNHHETFTAPWKPYRRVSSRGRHAQIRFSRGACDEKPENDRLPFWFYREVYGLPFSTAPQQHKTSFAEGGLPLLVYIYKYTYWAGVKNDANCVTNEERTMSDIAWYLDQSRNNPLGSLKCTLWHVAVLIVVITLLNFAWFPIIWWSVLLWVVFGVSCGATKPTHTHSCATRKAPIIPTHPPPPTHCRPEVISINLAILWIWSSHATGEDTSDAGNFHDTNLANNVLSN